MVPRNRFAPVKTCSDLFVLRSDAYVIAEDSTIALAPALLVSRCRRAATARTCAARTRPQASLPCTWRRQSTPSRSAPSPSWPCAPTLPSGALLPPSLTLSSPLLRPPCLSLPVARRAAGQAGRRPLQAGGPDGGGASRGLGGREWEGERRLTQFRPCPCPAPPPQALAPQVPSLIEATAVTVKGPVAFEPGARRGQHRGGACSRQQRSKGGHAARAGAGGRAPRCWTLSFSLARVRALDPSSASHLSSTPPPPPLPHRGGAQGRRDAGGGAGAGARRPGSRRVHGHRGGGRARSGVRVRRPGRSGGARGRAGLGSGGVGVQLKGGSAARATCCGCVGRAGQRRCAGWHVCGLGRRYRRALSSAREVASASIETWAPPRRRSLLHSPHMSVTRKSSLPSCTALRDASAQHAESSQTGPAAQGPAPHHAEFGAPGRALRALSEPANGGRQGAASTSHRACTPWWPNPSPHMAAAWRTLRPLQRPRMRC